MGDIKPRRRKWQVHLSTVLTLVVATGLVMLVDVAPRVSDGGAWREYGWPHVYYRTYLLPRPKSYDTLPGEGLKCGYAVLDGIGALGFIFIVYCFVRMLSVPRPMKSPPEPRTQAEATKTSPTASAPSTARSALPGSRAGGG